MSLQRPPRQRMFRGNRFGTPRAAAVRMAGFDARNSGATRAFGPARGWAIWLNPPRSGMSRRGRGGFRSEFRRRPIRPGWRWASARRGVISAKARSKRAEDPVARDIPESGSVGIPPEWTPRRQAMPPVFRKPCRSARPRRTRAEATGFPE